MVTKMFSVYDSKAAVFSVPFFMPSIGLAIRSFTDLSNDPGTMVFKHPEDFSLFVVGEFDDEKGTAVAVSHQNLGTAASYKKPERSLYRPPLINAEEILRDNNVEKEVVQ